MESIFLENIHHAYAQTDGTYAFPNSREGDLLRLAKKEIEELLYELKKYNHINVRNPSVTNAEHSCPTTGSLTNPIMIFNNDDILITGEPCMMGPT